MRGARFRLFATMDAYVFLRCSAWLRVFDAGGALLNSQIGMVMPLFSLILPIYNVERYLPFCIDSVRQQTIEDIEIICVDDGSRDRSQLIARAYASFDDRVKVVVKPNGGLSSARNAGIDAATGTYLMFVDSDDYLEKKACEKLLAAFEDHAADVVTFGANCVPYSCGNPWLWENLSPRDAVYEGFSTRLLFEENSHPFAWRTAVRRDVMLEHKIRFDEDVAFGEDQVFHFELYPLSRKTVLLSDKLYDYRVAREGSLMRRFGDTEQSKVPQHLAIVEAILAAWQKRDLLGLCPAELLDWTLDFLIDDMFRIDAVQRSWAFVRLGEILRDRFPDALSLAHALDPACAAVVALALDAASGANPAAEHDKKLERAYYCYRLGTGAYWKKTLLGPFTRLKQALKRVMPLPASSMQQYLDEAVDKLKVEQQIADSWAVFHAESAHHRGSADERTRDGIL